LIKISRRSKKIICEIFNYHFSLKCRLVRQIRFLLLSRACAYTTFLTRQGPVRVSVPGLVFQQGVHGLVAGHERQNTSSCIPLVSMGNERWACSRVTHACARLVNPYPPQFKPRLMQVNLAP
jgi:hypothetical protein